MIPPAHRMLIDWQKSSPRLEAITHFERHCMSESSGERQSSSCLVFTMPWPGAAFQRRRLDRLTDIQESFLRLASSLICLGFLTG